MWHKDEDCGDNVEVNRNKGCIGAPQFLSPRRNTEGYEEMLMNVAMQYGFLT